MRSRRSPGTVFSETAVCNVQYLAQCSEEDETKVLNLLMFFPLLSVYCLTPCQNSVHLPKLKRK